MKAPGVVIALLHPCSLSDMEVVVLPSPAFQGMLSYSQHSAVSHPEGQSAPERGEGYSGMGKSHWDPEVPASLPPLAMLDLDDPGRVG